MMDVKASRESRIALIVFIQLQLLVGNRERANDGLDQSQLNLMIRGIMREQESSINHDSTRKIRNITI